MEASLEKSAERSGQDVVDRISALGALPGRLVEDVVAPLQAAVAMLTSYKAFVSTSAAPRDPSAPIPTGTLDDAIQAIKYAYSAAENMRG